MDLRRTKLIQEAREAREKLLDINLATDTTNRVGTSRPYALLDEWATQNTNLFRKIYTVTGIYNNINHPLSGYYYEDDVEVFNEIRAVMVSIIDIEIRNLDKQQTVQPLLDGYIARIKDTKLAELLKEFNVLKDKTPNFAAMGFRTILSLIIQEKAKRVDPSSNTATKTDLAPMRMIDSARKEAILSSDEQRIIDSFVSTHKDIYDFVTHRPGILIDKNEVGVMVDLLNKFLPSIMN